RHNNYHKILVCVVLGLAAVGIALTPIESDLQPNEDNSFNRDLSPLLDYGFLTELAPFSAPSHPASGSSAMGKFAINEPAINESTISEIALRLDRNPFYTDTFPNPTRLTDISNLLAGPVSTWSILKAIWRLDRHSTTNLMVELGNEIVPGEQPSLAGPLMSAEPDILQSAHRSRTVKVFAQGLTLKAGVTCALFCHTALLLESVSVMESAPNSDLSLGLLMAMAGPILLPRPGVTSASVINRHGDLRPVTKPELMTKPEFMKSAASLTQPPWPVGAYSKPW